jgi:tetratricopeptide (TPR) repeat protein
MPGPVSCQAAFAGDAQASIRNARLEALLPYLARQQTKAGNISDALRSARSITYNFSQRTNTLRQIADTLAESGHKDEAGLILREVLAAVYAPGCGAGSHRNQPLGVAITQAKAGLNEDAAATFGEALQIIEGIEDEPVVKADGSTVPWFKRADLAKVKELSNVAKAQGDAGFKTQSAATFERAMQGATDLPEPRYRAKTGH